MIRAKIVRNVKHFIHIAIYKLKKKSIFRYLQSGMNAVAGE